MPYIPDNYDLFRRYDDEREEWLESRPICSNCKEPITAEKAIYINGDWICNDCIKNEFTRWID